MRFLRTIRYPRDIASVVEISDTSVSTDRSLKGSLYGRAAILVYWIVNIADRQVEVYTEPTGPNDPPENMGDRSRQVYRDTDSVPVVIRGQEIARLPVASLLPRA